MVKHTIISRLPSTTHTVDEPAELKEEEQLSQIELTALESILWRKLDVWIIPSVTIFHLLNLLDRSNIANASVAGLQKSLGMSHYQYTVALTVTSASLVAAQLPSTLLLKYVGPNRMLPAMAVLWGFVSTAQGPDHILSAMVVLRVLFALQGLVSDYSGLLVCRIFLGLLEGGLVPGIILYLSFFYPRRKLQTRIAMFYATSSLAGAFSGLLAAAIDRISSKKSGKPGWAWIFILEGVFTVVFGVVSFALLPRSPERARFFTVNERAHVVSALKKAGSMSEDETKDQFSWSEVAQAAKSPHLWFLAPALFFTGATFAGVVYFEPTVVASVGYIGNQAQLMSVPPYTVSFVLSLIAAIISDRHQCRALMVIIFSLLQAIGYTMYYVSTSSHVRYGSLFFSVSGALGTPPAVWAWISNNSAPHTRRATALAVGYMMNFSGAILAAWLLGSISPAPNYTTATLTLLGMSVGMAVCSIVNLTYLWRENRLKAARRTMGICKEEEPGNLGDRSAWFIYSL